MLASVQQQLTNCKAELKNFTIYQCDLGDKNQLGLLKEYIDAESDSIVHVHFAPSCGTASKARERPIPGLARHLQPKPLRSERLAALECERQRESQVGQHFL